MKKLVPALMITLLSAVAFASGSTDAERSRTHATPVVSVIALSAEQAQELATIRNEYNARKVQLEAEYAARLDAILASQSNS